MEKNCEEKQKEKVRGLGHRKSAGGYLERQLLATLFRGLLARIYRIEKIDRKR
jgi:hypothetical protein